MKKRIFSLLPMLLVANGYAGTMGPVVEPEYNSYIGVFGGGGALSSVSITQLGTAFFADAVGGPLAVNSNGTSNSPSQWLVGGQVGRYFTEGVLPVFSQWSIRPAAELEGYYIGRRTLSANTPNSTVAEHEFVVGYPMNSGVGIINAVASFNHADFMQWHPYVAGGLGAALVTISNAYSTQISPVEPGINHYNSSATASDTAFAAQGKVGLSYNWTPHLSIFGEYRYLFLGGTDYVFGSTSYAGHVPTSSWNVKLGAQSYNLGVGGIRYTF